MEGTLRTEQRPPAEWATGLKPRYGEGAVSCELPGWEQLWMPLALSCGVVSGASLSAGVSVCVRERRAVLLFSRHSAWRSGAVARPAFVARAFCYLPGREGCEDDSPLDGSARNRSYAAPHSSGQPGCHTYILWANAIM